MRDFKSSNKDESTLKLYGKTKAANFVKSAVYRWFQLYERPLSPNRISCQMDLLDERVRIISAVGKVYGKEHFSAELLKFNNRKNSFVIENINVYPCGINMYTAQTTVFYNGVNATGENKSYMLTFEADLKRLDDISYTFLRIKLKTKKEVKGNFVDAHSQNRSLGLIHYCMGLIEHQVKDPGVLKSCFLPEFTVQPLGCNPIHERTELIQWISNINGLIQGVQISPVNITVEEIIDSDKFYDVQFDLLFEGYNSAGIFKNSLSKNRWIIKDNANDCLPKIKSIEVEKLEPIFI